MDRASRLGGRWLIQKAFFVDAAFCFEEHVSVPICFNSQFTLPFFPHTCVDSKEFVDVFFLFANLAHSSDTTTIDNHSTLYKQE